LLTTLFCVNESFHSSLWFQGVIQKNLKIVKHEDVRGYPK
jgi:hypothetical protein